MKLSKLFLVCGIFMLYFSSIYSANIYMAIIGGGLLGMWFEYTPK